MFNLLDLIFSIMVIAVGLACLGVFFVTAVVMAIIMPFTLVVTLPTFVLIVYIFLIFF